MQTEQNEPPVLGGEPEVIYQLKNNALKTDWRGADKVAFDSAANLPEYSRRELVDRAHVAQLEAELERAGAACLNKNAECLALQGQCSELDSGLRAIATRRMTPADARLLAKQHLNRAGAMGANLPTPADDEPADALTSARKHVRTILAAYVRAGQREHALREEIAQLKAGLQWESERNALLLAQIQDYEGAQL